MRTLVVSDLHLGTHSGSDLLRGPGAARDALLERAAECDHLVLLGDVIELREAPLATALRRAEPFFRALGDAAGDARVTIVPGNHDHRLTAGGPPLARVADALGHAELRLEYPGVWIRPDVYATHGHYLDAHLATPTLERLAVAVAERAGGGIPRDRPTPDDYEAVLRPLYSLAFSLAQRSDRSRRLVQGGTTAAAWQRLSGSNGRRGLGAMAAGGLLLPGAVGLLNRLGFGPLTADLSVASLRRAGLRAIAEVVRSLGIDADHVLFGHTHRSGPWPADDESEWELAGGGRLTNTGSWLDAPILYGTARRDSPYWPGTCVMVKADGPPRLERLVGELTDPVATRTSP